MKKHAVLSAMGRDRVGVADDLNSTLASRRVAIEGSRWTALKGQFALIVEVCGEPDDIVSLDRDLEQLSSRLGFELQLKPIEPTPAREPAPQFMIECFSRGPQGLSAVTGIFKHHGINIEDMETDSSATPWSSEITFHMKARFSVPASFHRGRLRQELRELEHERNLDIVIRPARVPVGEPV